MTNIAYLSLKSKIYVEELSVMTNDAMGTIGQHTQYDLLWVTQEKEEAQWLFWTLNNIVLVTKIIPIFDSEKYDYVVMLLPCYYLSRISVPFFSEFDWKVRYLIDGGTYLFIKVLGKDNLSPNITQIYGISGIIERDGACISWEYGVKFWMEN